MLLSGRETESSPHPPSSLCARASASLRLSSVACALRACFPFFGQSRKKNKILFPADFFFSKFWAGGKICQSILSCYQKSQISILPNVSSIKQAQPSEPLTSISLGSFSKFNQCHLLSSNNV